MFVSENAVSSTNTVTSSPLATHSIQNSTGKPPQQETSNATLTHSMSAQPKPIHPKSRAACHCNTSEVTVVNMTELIQKFGQPPQNLTKHFATDYIADKYTIIIPTYQRNSGLLELLDHYCNATNVHKIVFIWHNVGTPVPEFVTNYNSCQIPFKFLTPDHNILSDRFRLTADVETEGKQRTSI